MIGHDGDRDAASTAEITRQITRGTARLFEDLGDAVVTELPLPNGRRADVAALARDGTLTLVEVKSGLPDFLADAKWPDYLEFCDRFHFSVGPDFPRERLPDAALCGLIVADGFEAAAVRPAPERRLPAARRKAMILRFARVAALRLRRIADPRG